MVQESCLGMCDSDSDGFSARYEKMMRLVCCWDFFSAVGEGTKKIERPENYIEGERKRYPTFGQHGL